MEKLRRFTEADVNYLIHEVKFIRAIPEIEAEEGLLTLKARIHKKTAPNWQVGGLIIKARVTKSIPGLPKALPSCALEWHGVRIRCVDYETRHDNPDGTTVRGWHEHIWNDEDNDKRVIASNPQITRPDMNSIFRWGLKKWNIEIIEEQLRMEEK